MAWPYFAVVGTLPRFIQALRRSKPSGDLGTWLTTSVGVSRTVARGELATLKRLGWVDDQSVTDRGWALRGENAAEAARETLRKCYPELLNVVERQPDSPGPALQSWLESNTQLGHLAVTRLVRTVLMLHQLAETGAIESPPPARSGRPKRHQRSHSTEGGVWSPGDTVAPRIETVPINDRAVQEVAITLPSGDLRIVAPRSLTPDDVRRIHAVVDLLVVKTHE